VGVRVELRVMEGREILPYSEPNPGYPALSVVTLPPRCPSISKICRVLLTLIPVVPLGIRDLRFLRRSKCRMCLLCCHAV
jgi:hypothetical protein